MKNNKLFNKNKWVHFSMGISIIGVIIYTYQYSLTPKKPIEIEKSMSYSLSQQATEIANKLNIRVDNDSSAEENKNNQLIISNNDKFVKIMFRNQLMYEKNSSKFTKLAIHKLKKIIFTLKKDIYSNTIIQTVGHTDSKGSFSYKKASSEKKAKAIIQIFQEHNLQNHLYFKGCSFSKPLVQNTSINNMALNNRIEIYLYSKKKFMTNPCKY